MKMRCFAAGELNAAGNIAIVLAQRWEVVLDARTSALGGHVLIGLEQWKRLGFHATMVVRIIAQKEK